MIVHTLITALALDEEDVQLTKQCYDSFIACKTSFVNDVMVDPRLHGKNLALTAKWNEFINFYRGKEYDYLMLCANDTIAHPDALEYMVKVMEDNKDVGILHPVMNRNKENFVESCIAYNIYLENNGGVHDSAQRLEPNPNYISYTPEIFFSPHETANMILRKGVIETVGEFDLLFPHERNEQDYFLRAKKMGIKLATSPMKLFYHPPHSQDDPNRQGLSVADKNWMDKWGADWFHALDGAGYQTPFNSGCELSKTLQST